jgi:HD-GYP domain-containing protein (c-di-GMP phosphodiesterase class II)
VELQFKLPCYNIGNVEFCRVKSLNELLGLKYKGFELENKTLFRSVFGLLIVLTLFFEGYIIDKQWFISINILIMIVLGLAFGRLFVQILISGGNTFLRYYLSPIELPEIDQFCFQWLSYFAIAFVVSTITKNYVSSKSTLIRMSLIITKLIDSKDKYTSLHSRNVSHYAYLIGKEMKLSQKQCESLSLGGLIHDIGKIGVPDRILLKSSKLTDEEYNIMKQHPVIGYEILKSSKLLRNRGILDMVLYHHERFDGQGYPYGLAGKEIPLDSRIISVADAFDAMTSQRIYRLGRTIDYAMNEIRKHSGTQFDPQVVVAFLTILKKGEVSVQQYMKSVSDL